MTPTPLPSSATLPVPALVPSSAATAAAISEGLYVVSVPFCSRIALAMSTSTDLSMSPRETMIK
jgi:hypothetical protein